MFDTNRAAPPHVFSEKNVICFEPPRANESALKIPLYEALELGATRSLCKPFEWRCQSILTSGKFSVCFNDVVCSVWSSVSLSGCNRRNIATYGSHAENCDNLLFSPISSYFFTPSQLKACHACFKVNVTTQEVQKETRRERGDG